MAISYGLLYIAYRSCSSKFPITNYFFFISASLRLCEIKIFSVIRKDMHRLCQIWWANHRFIRGSSSYSVPGVFSPFIMAHYFTTVIFKPSPNGPLALKYSTTVRLCSTLKYICYSYHSRHI